MPLSVLCVLGAFAALVIAVNVWYWRRRAKLTPEQRRAEDEREREELTNNPAP